MTTTSCSCYTSCTCPPVEKVQSFYGQSRKTGPSGMESLPKHKAALCREWLRSASYFPRRIQLASQVGCVILDGLRACLLHTNGLAVSRNASKQSLQSWDICPLVTLSPCIQGLDFHINRGKIGRRNKGWQRHMNTLLNKSKAWLTVPFVPHAFSFNNKWVSCWQTPSEAHFPFKWKSQQQRMKNFLCRFSRCWACVEDSPRHHNTSFVVLHATAGFHFHVTNGSGVQVGSTKSGSWPSKKFSFSLTGTIVPTGDWNKFLVPGGVSLGEGLNFSVRG